MKAVILAAGRGGRLRDVTGSLPKCLARIGAATILERQLAALRAAGIRDITLVAGYGIDDVRRTCGAGVALVQNTRYVATNSLYSLWLTRDLLTGPFVVLNCDVLFHQQILDDLLDARYEDALAIAARGDAIYSDEEMKVRVRAGRVVDIAKTIESADADGENVGIAKFGAEGTRVLVDELQRLVADGAARAWLPEAFAAFSRRRPLHAVETRGFPWIEIDFPEDYWRACAHVLPLIESDASPSHRRPVAAASGRTHRHV
jgi:choline kinase